MKLTAKHDLPVSKEKLAAGLEDFGAFEKMLTRRGVEIQRVGGRNLQIGMEWRVRVFYRGKTRRLNVFLERWDPGVQMVFRLDSAPMKGELTFDMQSLSESRTRLLSALDVQPKTIAARLLLQSLRLAKGHTQRKFERGIGRTCELFMAKAGAVQS